MFWINLAYVYLHFIILSTYDGFKMNDMIASNGSRLFMLQLQCEERKRSWLLCLSKVIIPSSIICIIQNLLVCKAKMLRWITMSTIKTLCFKHLIETVVRYQCKTIFLAMSHWCKIERNQILTLFKNVFSCCFKLYVMIC